MHEIIYLPSVEKDLVSAVDYLADTLGSVQAAENLLQEFEATVERIAQFPYANALYRTDRPIDHEIRKVAVKNYILYYTVFQDHVEIFRFIKMETAQHGSKNRAGLCYATGSCLASGGSCGILSVR